jgi:acetolactate synthase-1/2/3 large subunit
VRIDQFINVDLKYFFRAAETFPVIPPDWRSEWTGKCRHWRNLWPVCLPEYNDLKYGVNMYTFVNVLSDRMPDDAVVVSDAGSSYYVTSQAVKIRARQRYITSGAQADMGFALPAAIGVCVARDMKNVIAITGDGSLQLNLQELQTVVHNQMPVKLFILNNNGYMSIRATQNKFFEGRLIGTDKSSGLSFPDLSRLAEAYGIPYFRIASVPATRDIIDQVLGTKGPVICEVICPENQEVIPTVSSLRKPDGKMISKPLEDMYPFLNRGEFLREMIVPPVNES